MVKARNRPTTSMEPRQVSVMPELALPECPPLEVTVSLAAGASPKKGESVTAHPRPEGVRLLSRGQIVAYVEDEATVQTITACHEAGVRYQGPVDEVSAGRAVILLAGRR